MYHTINLCNNIGIKAKVLTNYADINITRIKGCVMTNKINPICGGGMIRLAAAPDSEHQQIMRRLMAYGVTPTGNKSADKALLREIELKLAKMENCVSSKFLTVTRTEQEKIQEDKKEKREDINPELNLNSTKGQEILGQQLMIALEMKKKAEEI